MDSSSDKQVSPPPHLISKVLHSGDSVRIGRKPFCEITVKSPFISGIHCRIDVTESQSSFHVNDGLHFFISDLSTNGTWVLKDTPRSFQGADSAKMQSGNEYHLAKKLPVKTKEELQPGDCILLLAPGHKECVQYRFVMKMKGSECILEQLPVASNGSKKTYEGSEGSVSSAAVVGSLTSAAGGRNTSWSDSSKVSGRKCSSVEVSSDGKTERPSSSSVLSESSLKEKRESFAMGRHSLETSARDLEMERCPNCWKLFPVYELPLHSPICQKSALKRKRSNSSSYSREEEAILTSLPTESRNTPPPTDFVEQCPHCLDLFPLDVLISHAETCSLASSTGSSHGSRGSSSGAESAKMRHATEEASVDGSAAPPVPMLMDTSQEQCPYCSMLFPIAELITHCASCRSTSTSAMPTTREEIHSTAADFSDVETDSAMIAKRARYTLEPFERSTATLFPSSSTEHSGSSLATTCKREDETLGKSRTSVDDGAVDLEQCIHCLKEFPVSELVSHAASCTAAGKESAAENCVLEHCQHCLNVFPLSELVEHALNCSQRKDVGSVDTDDGFVGDEELWGEPLERCMHCFKDFPLSKIIEHSRKCKGDMLGSRERFKNFLPSVHDLDAMSLAVLNETQMRAVEYVMEVSKKESESVYTQLRDRVIRLGYTERDLEKTLQWIRRDAPIIIHIHLDRVLPFLVKDTHYRNMFETHTGSGSLDKSARSQWEDRIFNNLYKGSRPVDRVKYGVLNIVGDPRGVRSCAGYGDSFLQLKKVRLRTTFASEDTSSSRVVLSCCEHYGNVLDRYNDSELKAILEVATRKVEFLRSDMIGQYKEIQIHGPVCLSENVDCIVVNDRHSADTAMRELLDEFVTKNECNLIWMERDDRIDYPSFTHTPTPIPSFIPLPTPTYPLAVLPPAFPHARRRHKRRRR